MLSIFILIAGAALALLNARGAYGLTGYWPMAVVFSAFAVVQWAAARSAFQTLLQTTQGPLRRGIKALPLFGLYLVAALITVPLTAAELGNWFGTTQEQQAQRLRAEGTRVANRARDLHVAFDDVNRMLTELRTHADAMHQQERDTGGSCLSSRGTGAGELARFREQEARLVASLAASAQQPLTGLAAIQKSLDELALQQQPVVADIGRQMTRQVDELNRLPSHPLLSRVSDFVSTAEKTGSEILIPRANQAPLLFSCMDDYRTQTLRSLMQMVKRIEQTRPLGPVMLLDAANSKENAMAAQMRNAAGVLALLPGIDQRRLLDPVLEQRYGLQDTYTLTAGRMPFIIAWTMELLLAALIGLQMAARQRTGHFAQRVRQALARQALDHVAGQTGTAASAARALTQAMKTAEEANVTVVDNPVPAFDARWAARWQLLHRYMVTTAGKDLLLIPHADREARAAARQAALAGLAKEMSSDLATTEVSRVHGANALVHEWKQRAGGNAGDGWALYMVHPPLAQFLLGCWGKA